MNVWMSQCVWAVSVLIQMVPTSVSVHTPWCWTPAATTVFLFLTLQVRKAFSNPSPGSEAVLTTNPFRALPHFRKIILPITVLHLSLHSTLQHFNLVCICLGRAPWGRADGLPGDLLADCEQHHDMHTTTASQPEDHVHWVLLSSWRSLGHGLRTVPSQKHR